MLQLIAQGQISLFLLIIIALVISLTFHEWGHAASALYFGDNTAQQMGRLTLNPVAHIDPMGLLMVVIVGFGFAKPVPTNPRNYNSRWASALVAAAGPGMNLVVAVLSINVYALGLKLGWAYLEGPGPQFFFSYLALINLLLMLFNLVPLGPLDGHYIMPYLLPTQLAGKYQRLNHKYGSYLLLGLVVLALLGVPIFKSLMSLGQLILPLIIFV
jgi:Zn-dependent protease